MAQIWQRPATVFEKYGSRTAHGLGPAATNEKHLETSQKPLGSMAERPLQTGTSGRLESVRTSFAARWSCVAERSRERLHSRSAIQHLTLR